MRFAAKPDIPGSSPGSRVVGWRTDSASCPLSSTCALASTRAHSHSKSMLIYFHKFTNHVYFLFEFLLLLAVGFVCLFVCLFVCFLGGFFETESLYSLGCPGTYSVDQAGLELTEITCLCLLSAGIKDVHHQTPLFSVFYYFF